MTDISLKKSIRGGVELRKADDSSYISKEEAAAFLERRQWMPNLMTRRTWAGAIRSARRILREAGVLGQPRA